MNRIFKVVWNDVRGAYTVCDENRTSHGKAKSVKNAVMLAAVVLCVIPPAIVYITCQKFLLQGVITSGLKS